MAAASTAAASGLRAALIDERPTLGGQVYKQPGPGMRVTDARQMGAQYRAGRALIEEAEASGADLLLRTTVVDLAPADEGWTAMVQTDGGPVAPVRAARVIVATGANDRPVVFPGWTLPGVITAGGLQTLAKTQSVIPGERIVFAGSGPVALAFPAQLAGYGANIVAALEAGPAPSPGDLIRIARAAPGNVGLLRDAAAYQAALLRHRIPLKYGRIVVRAEGDGRVERVVHARVDADWRVIPGTETTVEADVLCVGYGFTPSTELLRLVGCSFDSRRGPRRSRHPHGRLAPHRRRRRLRRRRRSRCRGLRGRRRRGAHRRPRRGAGRRTDERSGCRGRRRPAADTRRPPPCPHRRHPSHVPRRRRHLRAGHPRDRGLPVRERHRRGDRRGHRRGSGGQRGQGRDPRGHGPVPGAHVRPPHRRHDRRRPRRADRRDPARDTAHAAATDRHRRDRRRRA